MSYLALLLAQHLLLADAPVFAENYPGQRRYQRFIVQQFVELPPGRVAPDSVLVVRSTDEWEAMTPALRGSLTEWRGKPFILLGPKRHPISCGRHGFELLDGRPDLIVHLFPPTDARPESQGGCLIELPYPTGKVSVDAY